MMRRAITLLAVLALVSACHRRSALLLDSSPAHLDPNDTSLYGDWVMSTDPDSTAFVGARLVELSLSSSTFTLRAHYGVGGAPMVVTGTTSIAPGTSLVTLTPQSVTQGASMGRQSGLAPGQPVTVLASAAGGTMLFAPPTGSLAIPSSVWHRTEAARAAGLLGPSGIQAASRDSL
jgi:hypothetical protein